MSNGYYIDYSGSDFWDVPGYDLSSGWYGGNGGNGGNGASSSAPRPGDVVQTVAGIGGIIVEIIGGIAKIKTSDGATVDVPTEEVTIVDKSKNGETDWMPWAIGAAVLLAFTFLVKK